MGQNLLSELILDVCDLLGMKKINTTSYHPRTNGLVEKMNRALHSMLAKHAHKFGPDWDIHLQQLLFAYRVKPQDSTDLTGEAPFYLLLGIDATESAISQLLTSYQEDLNDYRTSLVMGLSEARRSKRRRRLALQKWTLEIMLWFLCHKRPLEFHCDQWTDQWAGQMTSQSLWIWRELASAHRNCLVRQPT